MLQGGQGLGKGKGIIPGKVYTTPSGHQVIYGNPTKGPNGRMVYPIMRVVGAGKKNTIDPGIARKGPSGVRDPGFARKSMVKKSVKKRYPRGM